jgi:oligopeptide transport system substrate-binding protein
VNQNKHLRIAWLVVLSLLTTLALAACGDNTATTAPATTSAATSAATTGAATSAATTTGAATSAATTGAATKAATSAVATTGAATSAAAAATTEVAVGTSGHPGIYREVWFGPDPSTLDPQASQPAGWTTKYMYGNLYVGLTDYDEKANVIPGIAKEWKASADNKVWTFSLNPAAKFSSGRQVTADDVVYTYERAVDPKLKNPQALAAVNDIVGATDRFAGKAEKISGIKVVDPATVEFTLNLPTPFFPSKLAISNVYILDKDIVESGAKWWETKSAGAGPFQLAEWQHSQSIALTPNPGWYGSKVKLNRIEYLMVGDSSNRLSVFESGKTDAHWSLLTAEIDRISKDKGELGKTLVQVPEGLAYSFSFFMNANGYEPFKNVKVRKAVSMVLDPVEANDKAFNGAGIAATGIIASGMPGFKPNQSKIKFDPTAAKQLLKDAGYDDGSKLPPLTLTQIGTGADIKGFMEYAQNSLKENLGMNVTIQVVDQAQFIGMVQQGKVAAWLTILIGGYPDPYSMLSNFSSKSPQNYYGYNNPEVDGMLFQALGTADNNARYALYQQIESKLLDDAAVAPIMWGKLSYLKRPYVTGYRVNTLGIMPFTNIEVK